MSLEERVREQAEKVRKMKAEKAPKDQVKTTLEEWLSWQQPVVHKWCIKKYCCSCIVHVQHMLALRGLPSHNLAFQASLTSIDCPSTLALLDHHFLDHSYVSPEHTMTDMDLVLFKALGDGAADDKGAGLVGLQRWKRQISSRLSAGGGGLQALGGKQVTLGQVLESISKDKPSKIKVNKTCDNVSVFSWLPVFNIKSRSMTASPFSEL